MDEKDEDIFSLDLRIEAIASHRNGVGGEYFHVVLFEHKHEPMLGIVFGREAHVAVLQREKLAKGDIAPRTNSWRGDVYEHDLRRAIAKWEDEQLMMLYKKMHKEDEK